MVLPGAGLRVPRLTVARQARKCKQPPQLT